jgi:hypothetical protein
VFAAHGIGAGTLVLFEFPEFIISAHKVCFLNGDAQPEKGSVSPALISSKT